MPETRHCPKCGAAVPGDSLEGLCPRCVARLAFAAAADPGSSGDVAGALSEKIGDRIGPYRLLQQIGEGGCGVVYLAEQEEPVRRRVALKVIKLGMDTKEVIARFEAERQALALMDHPNIAKVLDAGATGTGRPYFVMELVRGLKITEFCDENHLSTRERLALFAQVCHAIQHAHQKGVIHRDIKPSNILVTLHDNLAVPKIIDFGIAKAIEQRLTDKTLFTSLSQFIGTPAYMSPEQARLSRVDIDTRSDIYSLGVLLYELLTGQTPFDARRLLEAGLDEIRRIIREEDPPRPSTRLSTLDRPRQTAAASQRQAELPRLITVIRGDLDWIVMKCLEKDRTRRYETANALAQDVERHLRDEPVSAAAPSMGYRTRKFVRRHRAVLATAGALVFLLAAGVVASLWQAVRATRAEREQRRLLAEAQSARAEAVGQRERAEKEQNKAQEQAGRAEDERAKAEAQQAEAERQRVEADAQRANALVALKQAETERANAEESRNMASNEWTRAEAALRELRDQKNSLEKTMGFMLFDLSEKLQRVGRLSLLHSVTEAVLAHYKSLPENAESEESLLHRCAAFRNLGLVLVAQGDSSRALEAYRTSLGIAEKAAEHSSEGERWDAERCACHQKIGEIWQSRGDSERALQEFQVSLKLARGLAARQPENLTHQQALFTCLVRVGEVLQVRTDASGALVAFESAMQTAQTASQRAPKDQAWQWNIADCHGRIGLLLLQEQDVERASGACRSGLEIAQQLATQDPGDPQWQSGLALAHDRCGDVELLRVQTDKALGHYQEALSIRQRLVKTDPDNSEWQRAMLHSYLKIGRTLSRESRKSQTWKTFMLGFKHLGEIHAMQKGIAQRLFSPEDLTRKPLEVSRESLGLARQLASHDPANTQWQVDLAQSHTLLGDLLMQAGEGAPALEEYRAALQIREGLARTDADAEIHQYELALARLNEAGALQRLSLQDEAGIAARNGFGILSDGIARWPGNLAFTYGPYQNNRTPPLVPEQRDAVATAIKQACAAITKQAMAAADDENCQAELAACETELAAFSLLFEDIGLALAHMEKAIAVRRYLVRVAPENRTYHEEAVKAYVALSALQLLDLRNRAAGESARQGLQLDANCVALKAILTLAHLFKGDVDAARALLRENERVEIRPQQYFPDAVWADALRFRAKGLAIPELGRIESILNPGSDRLMK